MPDLPRSTTDLRIAIPCTLCCMLGKTSYGPCDYCGGTGWQLKEPARLTPTELDRLAKKLPPAEN